METAPTEAAGPESTTARARVDRYTLLRTLGAGGMGEVWEAHDPELDRSVAVKLLRRGDPERLVREARAMARLGHPNVLTVFDAGVDGGRVWVAMERVDGGTLRDLFATRPPLRELVGVFVAAARGLAHAHAAGIIHRDFKPDNVLLGKDGRPRVADFGLARSGIAPAQGEIPVVPGDITTAETIPGSGDPGGALTRDGSLLGTPAYMAPEQHAGGEVDARADQFAFCVSLWEAVHGERPYAPPDGIGGPAAAVELARRVTSGERRPPRRRVPGWLRAVLDRGLAVDPARRFPSMDALADALERGLGRRRRVAAVVALAVAGGAIGAALLVGARGDEPPCRGAAAEMRGVWDEPRRAEIEQAFAATGAEFAPGVLTRLVPRLDARRDAWIAMRTESCEATHVRRAQPPDILARRTACLDDRRRELAALTDRLARADRTAIATALDALEGLTPISRCADRGVLDSIDAPPADPAARRRAAELADAVIRLDAAGQLEAGASSVDEAARLADEAASLGLRRLSAWARMIEGREAIRADDTARGLRAYESAAQAASAAGADDFAVTAWTLLVQIHADRGEVAEARALLSAARAASLRAGERLLDRHRLLSAEGAVAMAEGDYVTGRAKIAEALPLAEQMADERADELINDLTNLGRFDLQLGQAARGLESIQRALALVERDRGRTHPDYFETLVDLGRAQRLAGDAAAGRRSLEEAVAGLEAAYGDHAANLIPALMSLGNAASQLGDHPAALAAARRGVELSKEHRSERLASAMTALSVIQMEAGDEPGAKATIEAVLPELEKTVGKDHVAYAHAEMSYANRLDCAPAVPRFEHAIAVFTARLGDRHEATITARYNLAECQAEADPAAALPVADALVADCDACSPRMKALAAFLLGQLEWKTGRDRPRAVSRVREARAALEALGPPGARILPAVDEWLAAHPAPTK